ncbi:SPOR domain-containing protein [Thermomonas sp.]|uniref:SPOR domain-containing protein n=1 Tax=Thermomonas sp. TaxID=1971895 RepID=UPI0035B01F2E
MDASLKQRLIGAVVLIALGVIFLPMLVKGPAPDSGVSDVSLRVPAEPKSADGMVTQDLPLAAPAAAPANGVSGMPGTLPDAAPASPPTAASADPASASLAAVAAGGFAVSFGNYANEADADKVLAALRASGLPGYREAVTLGSRQAQRVRIGPFADQATAESARLRAGQVRGDVVAKVVTLDAAVAAEPATVAAVPAKPEPKPEAKPEAKPEPAKPVVASKPEPVKPAVPPAAKPEPAKPAAAGKPEMPKAEPPPAKPANPAGTGFVVQIGAFASSTDATAQRDALRKAGFNAFTDTVPGPHGALTRVRVGPVLTRAEADALKAKLKDAGKDGMVRPHP